MAVVLIFNHVYWFSQKTTLGKLVTIATRKRLFLIYKIENFANTQFWKVTKFQGASLFRCGVLSNLLGMGWKTPPPPPPSAYRVKLGVFFFKNLRKSLSSMFCMYILAFYEIDQAKTLDLVLHQEQRFFALRVNFIQM